ncbi:MAG: phosphoglycerate kinase [Gammaproteobacteria bacterium]|nr:MAG: phosphoglycerate kinase [Gammaproteobacteria bacterium]
MTVIRMTDLNLSGKKVLIREDLNVPLQNGKITDDTRIFSALFTIQLALRGGAKVILMSHLGRPTEGEFEEKYSLTPVADRLSALLRQPVRLVDDWENGIEMNDGELVLLENVRFNEGEKKNDSELAKKLAAICDIYVMDAFGTAHRAHASTHGVAKYAPIACAGPLLVSELEKLTKVLKEPKKPFVAIVGGSKVSTKLGVLEAMSREVDHLIVGGGIANTFIAAAGYKVGKSLYQEDFVDEATRLIEMSHSYGGEVEIPIDVVCSKDSFDELSNDSMAEVKLLSEIEDDDYIYDIGPQSTKKLEEIIENANVIVWNGPVGVFETDKFGEGTRALGEAVADSNGYSIAGGGDTLAAILKYNLSRKISYVTTGGGALLEFLEGRKLVALAVLEERAQQLGKYAQQLEQRSKELDERENQLNKREKQLDERETFLNRKAHQIDSRAQQIEARAFKPVY